MSAGTCIHSALNDLDYFYNVKIFLVIEEPFENQKKLATSIDTGPSGNGGKPQASKKVSTKRWLHIKCFHILEPCDVQVYIASDLHCPHYQVAAEERVQYLKSLSKILSTQTCTDVKTYKKNEKQVTNNYITVINGASVNADISKLCEHASFKSLCDLVNNYKESESTFDSGRGNVFFDKGLNCAKNLGHNKKHYGLATPRLRSVSNVMTTNDKLFCDVAESILLNIAKNNLPRQCKGKESKLYNVPMCNSDFLTDTARHFHATRYAMTDDTHVLNIHVDSQNPGMYTELEDCNLNMPVVCYARKVDNTRVTIIGYGRDSVVQSSLRKLKYERCLKTIIDFYNSCSDSNKKISSNLVKTLSTQVKMDGMPHCFPLHTNKMVSYSVYIDRILYLLLKYNLDVYHRIVLVYSAILSESPDYYMRATDEMMMTSKKIWSCTDVMSFAQMLYNKIWEMKRHDSEEKKTSP